MLNNWAGNLEGYAKRNAPWTDRTSQARQGLHAGVDIENDGFHLFLAHGVEHGSYLEIGTGIYGPKGKPIRPVKAKALMIPGPDGPIFVKQVKGMRKRPIIEPAIKTHKDRLERTIDDYWGD